MSGILEFNYEGTADLQSLSAIQNTLDGPISYLTGEEPAGLFETAGLLYKQETIIGSTISYGFSKDRQSGAYVYDKQFNPYRYFMENREKYGDIEAHMRKKMFHDIVNEQQFLDRAERLRGEARDRVRLAEGSGWGMLLGMGLSLLDLATLIPVGGALHKGTVLARAGKMALAGGTLSTAQESVLHMQQDLRTSYDTLMAIGTGTAFGGILGGGLGAFQKARQPGHILHPESKNNPMRADNPLYVGIGQVGKKMSESAVIRPVIKKGKQTFEVVKESSVGAKAVEAKDAAKALKAPVASTLAKITPLGRMMYAKSEKVREIGMKLLDTGGILMDSMGLGKSQLSVEDLTARYMFMSDSNFLKATDEYITLRMDLEELIHGKANETMVKATDRLRQAARLGQETYYQILKRETDDYLGKSSAHLEEFEFVDLTYKQLFDDITEAEMDNLISRFTKEGADKILAATKARAKAIHEMNEVMENLMVREGMIREDQRMGNDYGIAQIWNPAAMRGVKRDQIVQLFIQKLAGKPDGDFLDQYKMSFDDFDNLGVRDVTIDGRTYTPDQGKAFKQEILEEWSGTVLQKEELAASIELDIAKQQENNARRTAVQAASDLRKNNTQIKHAAVDEARKILKLRQAEREKAQLKARKLQLEKQEIDTELRRLEAEQKERMGQFHEVGKWQRKYKKNVGTLENKLEELEQVEGGASYKSIDDVRRMLTEADNQLENFHEPALTSAVHEASLRPVYNQAIAKLKERQRMIARETQRLNHRLERLGPKVDALDDAVRAADDAHRNLQGRTKLLKEARKKAAAEARDAKKETKKKKKSLRKVEKKLPVHEYVEDMVDRMGKQQSIPNGFLEAHHFASARTKDRQLDLTNEERRQFIELGALRNDVYGVIRQAHQDISTRLAMRELFGTENVNDILKELDVHYREMLQDANVRGLSDKHKKSIVNEQRSMKKTVRGVWERHLGIHELPRDPDSMGHWSMKKLREWNFIRYGTGFLISSLTDLATVTMHVGFGALTARNIQALRATTRGMKNDELRKIAVISEAVLHANRNMKIAGLDDLRQLTGVGDHGTFKHNTTSTIDRVFNGLTETANFASAMSWWNTRLKALAMLEMQHNMYAQLAKTIRNSDGSIESAYGNTLRLASAGDKNAELQIAKLASLGLGQEQVARIVKMMNKHKPNPKDGTYELEMHRWLDEGLEGQMAYEDAMSAFRRVANRAVMTPGVGDTPLFMSKPIWKTIGQFQTYGFVTVNRYVVPGIQRGMTYHDMDAVLSFGFTAMLGSTVVLTKDLINRGEIRDRTPSEWAYDIIDRSGLMMYLSTPSAGVYNMAAYWTGSKSRPSRYSQTSSRFATMGGPAGGLINDIWDTVDAARYGDGKKAGQKAMKLLPFQIYLRSAQQIHNNL